MTGLSPCGDRVRKGDPVRFRTALFAPPDAREGLFALYAFNLEIAKIAPLVSEPMIGAIRLQWWRDSLDSIYGGGAVRRHEVVDPLCAVVRGMTLPRAPFDALIDARASDLDAEFPATPDALTAYLHDTAGSLTNLSMRALGSDAESVARDAGLGIGTARYLAAIPVMAMAGGKPVPGDIDWRALRMGEQDAVFTTQIREMAGQGRDALQRARARRAEVSKQAAPAVLEVPVAARRLAAVMDGPCTLTGMAQPNLSPFRENFSNFWRGAFGRW